MSSKQKIALILSCIFYVLTIYGFFRFSTTLLLLLFLAHSVALITFAYLCYQVHSDYAEVEHLQQEIGALRAELSAREVRGEMDDREAAQRERALEQQLQDTELLLTETRKELEILREQAEDADAAAGDWQRLLPEEAEESAPVDIIGVARTAIAELSKAAKEHGLAVRISSASSELLVRAGRVRLLTLFRNIIDNSIKYMQKEGSLVITISAIEEDLFVVLKDTGRGLPEEETARVFELNFQGSNRLSGNGLGLAQARAIVLHYGGTIYARSTPDNGFAIYIQIPARIGAAS